MRAVSHAVRGSNGSHFKHDSLCERDNRMNSSFRLMILESGPLRIFTSSEFRRFNVFKAEVRKKTVQTKIIKFVELVEQNIKKEIEHMHGEMMFDEWSKRSFNYVAMIALDI